MAENELMFTEKPGFTEKAVFQVELTIQILFY